MRKWYILILLVIFCSGCGGIGLYKKCTLIPDEIWISGDTNPEHEDSGELGFGMKWRLK